MLPGIYRVLSYRSLTRVCSTSTTRFFTISNASSIMSKRKAGQYIGKSNKRQKKAVKKSQFEGSHEEILAQDIKNLLLSNTISNESSQPLQSPAETEAPTKFSEVEIRISELSSTGDAIGFGEQKDHAFVVPFALPGELVKAKVIRTQIQENYSVTDFLEVLEPSSKRQAELIKCPYFAKCSGCQFQMTPYEEQLKFKTTVVKKAYQNFSSLAAEAVPTVASTIGSPLQYDYRTKLTPHFDGPPGAGFRNKNNKTFETKPPFGFMQKNTRWTIDIEDCPIGTPAVREGLQKERQRFDKEFSNYSRGATILLRESTERQRVSEEADDARSSESVYNDIKTCITNSNETSTEYIDSYVFTNPAGSFFQNNNSILPIFTQYIRDQISRGEEQQRHGLSTKPLSNLVDAYCGSGLFTITLSSMFKSSIGVDIAGASIKYAEKNAKLNNVENTKFLAATASELFKEISFDPEETLVVIDPPRKGCDNDFLQQLLRFGPRRVAYVSCNVHTQARDVGVLVNGLEGYSARYKLDSLQGFDFFPQTGHVESVAFLSKQE